MKIFLVPAENADRYFVFGTTDLELAASDDRIIEIFADYAIPRGLELGDVEETDTFASLPEAETVLEVVFVRSGK